MKVVWEESDIVAGRRLQKPDCGITGSWIIGYDPTQNVHRYALIAVSDGMIRMLGTKQDVVEHLNKLELGELLPVELCPSKWMASE